MTQLLNRDQTWGPGEIEARQRWLAEIAEQLSSTAGALDPSEVGNSGLPLHRRRSAAHQIRVMIADDESRDAEFKSTARTNTYTGEQDYEMEKGVGKYVRLRQLL